MIAISKFFNRLPEKNEWLKSCEGPPFAKVRIIRQITLNSVPDVCVQIILQITVRDATFHKVKQVVEFHRNLSSPKASRSLHKPQAPRLQCRRIKCVRNSILITGRENEGTGLEARTRKKNRKKNCRAEIPDFCRVLCFLYHFDKKTRKSAPF